MRAFLKAVKAGCVLLSALLCAAFAILLLYSPVFEEGEAYELYFGASSSSEIASTHSPFLDKLLRQDVAGESVRYSGNCYEALKARFCAELLFTEEAAGVTSYYLYSPLLGEGVLLDGRVVNLQIAVGSGQTAAGTPLIFGGF